MHTKKMTFTILSIITVLFFMGWGLFYSIAREEIKGYEWLPLSTPYTVSNTAFQTKAFQLAEKQKYNIALRINYNESREAVDRFVESLQIENPLLVWELTKEGKSIVQEKFTKPQGQSWGHDYTDLLIGRFSVETSGLYSLSISTLDEPLSEKLAGFSPYLQISVNSLLYEQAAIYNYIFLFLSKICLYIGVALLLVLLILKIKNR